MRRVRSRDVEQIIDSDLYLRYVLGEVPPLALPRQQLERHIRCNPALAQFIVDPAFEPVRCEGIFAKENLDGAFVQERETLVTRAWRRLQEIPRLGIPITEYPLCPKCCRVGPTSRNDPNVRISRLRR